MNLNDDETRAELITAGIDPDAEVERMRRFTDRMLRTNEAGFKDGLKHARDLILEMKSKNYDRQPLHLTVADFVMALNGLISTPTMPVKPEDGEKTP